TPALVEDITVEYYGQKLPIKQMGSISVVLPREIQITVWDASAVNAIAKAVSNALNLSASPDGNTVHVNLPSLTQERKDEIIKMIKAKTEDTRIKSRNARDDIKKKMSDQEKEGGITEDERFKISEDIQKDIDKFNKEIDEILEKKIVEINE
ncbi:MAG: ribosome-recycling factor, partial [Candidatus Paceibacterota bacterium]